MCRLHLQDDIWKPIGINTEPTSKHSNRPGEDVFACYLYALVGHSSVKAWLKKEFVRYIVEPNGSLRPLDLSVAAEALSAGERDFAAKRQGAHGINVRLARDKWSENHWEPAHDIYQAALDSAAELMIRRRTKPRIAGVTLLPDYAD